VAPGNLLVTGATGFLGSSIGEAFARRGWKVVGCARRDPVQSPFPVLLQQYDADSLSSLFARSRPEVIVHAAGLSSVARSISAPHEDFEASVALLQRVLEALRRSALRPRLVVLSSAAVYGNPMRLPVAETDALAPVSPYGFHKLAAENLAREYAQCFGVPALVARLFSTLGARQRRLLAWDVFRKFRDDAEVVLDGTGNETRDFLHAEDIAAMLAAVLDHADWTFTTLNIASGNATRVREMVAMVGAALGAAKAVRYTGVARAGDPLHWQADMSAYRALTGRETAFDLRARVAETVRAWRA